jgi:hypothetical protein
MDSRQPLRLTVGCAVATLLVAAAFVCAVLLMPLKDRQRLYVRAFGDTEYAPGYDERAFEAIAIGATYAEVIAALGSPLSDDPKEPSFSMLYASGPSDSFARSSNVDELLSYTCFDFSGEEKLDRVFGQRAVATGPSSAQIEMDFKPSGRNHLRIDEHEASRLIAARSTPADIEARYGRPTATYRNASVRWLKYSRSPSGSDYEQRWIGLDRDGRVCFKRAEAYFD